MFPVLVTTRQGVFSSTNRRHARPIVCLAQQLCWRLAVCQVKSKYPPAYLWLLAACFLREAPGLGRRAARNCSVGRVLMTSFFSSQPRRAMVTPCRINAKLAELCESVEMTTFTPRSLHILR